MRPFLNSVVVPGRVGGRMLSRFDFFYEGQLDHLIFWWRKGCFFQQLKHYFLDKVKAFIFVTINVFLQLLLAKGPYTQL